MQSKIFKHTSVYIFVGFLPVAANFLLAPVYTNFLDPGQYALIGIATLFQAFLTFFLSLSLDAAFSRLYFDYEKKPLLKNALLSTLLISVIVTSVVVFLVLFFIGDWLFGILLKNPGFRFSNLGYWVVITTFSNVAFLFFVMLYRNEERLKTFVLANLIFFFIPVAATLVGLIVLQKGALGAIAGRAAGSFLVIGAMLIHYFTNNKPVLKLKYLKIAINYSFPLIPYSLMFVAFSNIDRIFIERTFTPHDFGVYNFAIMITGLIPIFLNALTNATIPRIYRELANDKDFTKIRDFNFLSLFATTGVICLCVACVVPAMRLLINAEYQDAYPYVGTLFLGFLPYVHYLVYSMPFSFYGKTKAFPAISFFALITGGVFNYLLIPFWGIWAVCLSLYIIRGMQLLISYVYTVLYKFHILEYLRQAKAVIGSLIIILSYSLCLLLHYLFNFSSIDMINLVPLGIFMLLCFFIYQKELKFVYSLFSRSKNYFNKRF